MLDSTRRSYNQPSTKSTKCLSIWFAKGTVLKLTIKQSDDQYLFLVHFSPFIFHRALKTLIRNKNNLSNFCFLKRTIITRLCSQDLIMTQKRNKVVVTGFLKPKYPISHCILLLRLNFLPLQLTPLPESKIHHFLPLNIFRSFHSTYKHE